jgi:integrase/recombinase XerD
MSAVALDLQAPDVIIRPMLTTDRAVDLFLGDLARRGYSDRTRTTYSRILDKLCDRLSVDQDVSKVTPDDCRRFLDGYNRRAAGTRAHTFSVLSSFFGWLYRNEKISRNPLERVERPRRIPAADLDVTTVSTQDAQRLMLHAQTWPEKLTLGVLLYAGPRRKAAAGLRLNDYDRARGRLRFREKGGKVIWKPVPADLDQLIEAAIAAGAIEAGRAFLPAAFRTDSPYLIPPRGPLQRRQREDRQLWDIVKDVAGRAGVEAHVHALRAAFAVYYLETTTDPRGLIGLQELLGHKSSETTRTYLRKLDRAKAMEPVRELSWGVAMTGETDVLGTPQRADERLAESPLVGAGGFEPPFPESPHGQRDSGQP